MSLGIKSSAFLRVEETGASKFEVHTCLQLVGTLGKKLFSGFGPIFFDMPSSRKIRFEETCLGDLGPKELLNFVQHQYCNKMGEARPRNLEIWEIGI